ncbi:lysoplasmalogenase [Streptomyces sp. TRM66268-LWL]|uniref:Lysoplasmalogenase n=1 Tax=Streptomyces polyasparticus TaxID=2767826 RepID=A0ABR7S8N4_9ACTN|nr:lysoplasmalogenase [Streptomyces polyasparticus]MBC9711825.1 lysoplasmalogenase [Streptomyces polyasparticus]
MRRPSVVFATAFGVALAGDLVSLLAGWDLGHTVCKPLLMPLLAAYAVVRGAPRLLLVALFFGWCGDVLLMFDADAAFLAGMGGFALGHVCYLVLFARHGRRGERADFLLATYSVVLVATLPMLWPDLPSELRIPVVAYSLLLTAMAFRAARMGAVAGVGGALFLLSDTLIATGIADWPQLPRPDFWIMLTYAAAQALLVRGVLTRIDAQKAPGTAYGESRAAV